MTATFAATSLRTAAALAAVAALLPAGPAGARAHGSAAHSCPKSARPILVNRHNACIKRATLRRLPSASMGPAGRARQAQRLLDGAQRRFNRRFDKLLGRRRAPQARRLLRAFAAGADRAWTGAPRAAAAQVAGAAPAAAIELPSIAGWTTRSSAEPAAPNPSGGEAGGTLQLDATTLSPGPHALRLRIRKTTSKTATWNCPDGQGNATGTVRYRETRGRSRRGAIQGDLNLDATTLRFRITFEGTVDSSSSFTAPVGAARWDTGSHTAHASFRLVWPDARFASDDDLKSVNQGCGGSADCNDGRATFEGRAHGGDSGDGRVEEHTCVARDASPAFNADTNFMVNWPGKGRPGMPNDTVPSVPSVRFLGFWPSLSFGPADCTSVKHELYPEPSTTTETSVAYYSLDNFACTGDEDPNELFSKWLIRVDFFVSQQRLLEDETIQISVGNGPGITSPCDDPNGNETLAFRWSGRVTFVRLQQ